MSNPNTPDNIFMDRGGFISVANVHLHGLRVPPALSLQFMSNVHRVEFNNADLGSNRPSATYTQALLSGIPEQVREIPTYLRDFATTAQASSIMGEDAQRLENALQSYEWPHNFIGEVDPNLITIEALSHIFNADVRAITTRLKSANSPFKVFYAVRANKPNSRILVTAVPRIALKKLVTWKQPISSYK